MRSIYGCWSKLNQAPMDGKKAPTSVNIRVPMQLLRAGVRLASLIPAQAHQHLDEALSQHGVPLTLSQIKPENLEELIDHLGDLTSRRGGSKESNCRRQGEGLQRISCKVDS
jgi:hypothetical protein